MRAQVRNRFVLSCSRKGIVSTRRSMPLSMPLLSEPGSRVRRWSWYSSYFLAASIAGSKHDEEQRSKLETTAAEIVDRLPAEHSLRFRIWRASPAELQQIREAKPPGWDEDIEVALDVLEAIKPHGRTYDERIAILERAQDRLKSEDFHLKLDLEEQIAATFAEVHRQHGDVDQQMAWYRRVLAHDPAHPVARRNLAALLQEHGEWRELIDLLRTQVQLFGEYPDVLLLLGHALIEAGSPGEATKPLHRAKQLAAQPELVGLIEKEFNRAMCQAPDVPPPPPVPATLAVGLRELEACLSSFAEHVKRERRMEFWQSDDQEHRWASKPESVAKSLLRSDLHGHFQERAEVLDEIRSGAGRIDLYVRFEGGLGVVIELKMCGAPYSAGYAEEGIDQLVHYMENKGTSVGYLVVFDARKRDNAKPFTQLFDTGRSTVRVVFVDVRRAITQ